MRRRRWIIVGLVALAGISFALGVGRASRGEERGLGRGVHFLTLVARPSKTAPMPFPAAQVVEEWVSFVPFRWRAEILNPTTTEARAGERPALLGISGRTVFLCDGQNVILLNEAEGEAYTVKPGLAAGVRAAKHPLIFPEDFLSSELQLKESPNPRRSEMTLSGDGFSSVILEKDVSLPSALFAVPAGYRLAGSLGTTQELTDRSELSASVTPYVPGSCALPPLARAARGGQESSEGSGCPLPPRHWTHGEARLRRCGEGTQGRGRIGSQGAGSSQRPGYSI